MPGSGQGHIDMCLGISNIPPHPCTRAWVRLATEWHAGGSLEVIDDVQDACPFGVVKKPLSSACWSPDTDAKHLGKLEPIASTERNELAFF